MRQNGDAATRSAFFGVLNLWRLRTEGSQNQGATPVIAHFSSDSELYRLVKCSCEQQGSAFADGLMKGLFRWDREKHCIMHFLTLEEKCEELIALVWDAIRDDLTSGKIRFPSASNPPFLRSDPGSDDLDAMTPIQLVRSDCCPGSTLWLISFETVEKAFFQCQTTIGKHTPSHYAALHGHYLSGPSSPAAAASSGSPLATSPPNRQGDITLKNDCRLSPKKFSDIFSLPDDSMIPVFTKRLRFRSYQELINGKFRQLEAYCENDFLSNEAVLAPFLSSIPSFTAKMIAITQLLERQYSIGRIKCGGDGRFVPKTAPHNWLFYSEKWFHDPISFSEKWTEENEITESVKQWLLPRLMTNGGTDLVWVIFGLLQSEPDGLCDNCCNSSWFSHYSRSFLRYRHLNGSINLTVGLSPGLAMPQDDGRILSKRLIPKQLRDSPVWKDRRLCFLEWISLLDAKAFDTYHVRLDAGALKGYLIDSPPPDGGVKDLRLFHLAAACGSPRIAHKLLAFRPKLAKNPEGDVRVPEEFSFCNAAMLYCFGEVANPPELPSDDAEILQGYRTVLDILGDAAYNSSVQMRKTHELAKTMEETEAVKRYLEDSLLSAHFKAWQPAKLVARYLWFFIAVLLAAFGTTTLRPWTHGDELSVKNTFENCFADLPCLGGGPTLNITAQWSDALAGIIEINPECAEFVQLVGFRFTDRKSTFFSFNGSGTLGTLPNYAPPMPLELMGADSLVLAAVNGSATSISLAEYISGATRWAKNSSDEDLRGRERLIEALIIMGSKRLFNYPADVLPNSSPAIFNVTVTGFWHGLAGEDCPRTTAETIPLLKDDKYGGWIAVGILTPPLLVLLWYNIMRFNHWCIKEKKYPYRMRRVFGQHQKQYLFSLSGMLVLLTLGALCGSRYQSIVTAALWAPITSTLLSMAHSLRGWCLTRRSPEIFFVSKLCAFLYELFPALLFPLFYYWFIPSSGTDIATKADSFRTLRGFHLLLNILAFIPGMIFLAYLPTYAFFGRSVKHVAIPGLVAAVAFLGPTVVELTLLPSVEDILTYLSNLFLDVGVGVVDPEKRYIWVQLILPFAFVAFIVLGALIYLNRIVSHRQSEIRRQIVAPWGNYLPHDDDEDDDEDAEENDDGCRCFRDLTL